MLFPDSSAPETISLRDGQLVFWPRFLAAEEADRLFRAFCDTVDWRQSTLTIAGQPRKIPRLNAWYGEAGYGYSGVQFPSHPWTEALYQLKQRVEAVTGAAFNSVLMNLYRDGNDSVGWHSDNEPELGDSPVIASVSLGETRTFQLKHIAAGKTRKLPLSHGSLLLMAGGMQRYWRHQVPKERHVSGARINGTFRMVYPQRTSREPLSEWST